MNKIRKYISFGLTGMLGVAFATSCDTSKNNDDVTYYDGEPGIYFATTEESYLEIDPQKSTITYYAYRDEGGPEVTVPLYVDPMDYYDVSDIYTFPSSVTFPAGSKLGEIVIGYDSSKAPLGEEQQYLLTLDTDTTPFSSNSIVITLVNPADWNLLGTDGKYYDMMFWVDLDYNNGPAIVSVYQRADLPNIFRISNPYVEINENQRSYFQFELLKEGDYFMGSPVNYPDLIGFNMFELGYLQEVGGTVYLSYPAMFQGFESSDAWLQNTVVDYQDNGLPGMITLSPVYYLPDTGDAYGDPSSPLVYIYFPGYDQKDTNLGVTYEGTIIDSQRDEYVLIDVTMGEDLTSARAAVSKDLSPSQLIAAIEAGTVDYVSFSEAGNVKIPFANMETGTYNVAVVGYIDDAVKNTVTSSFFYISSSSNYDPNEGWSSLGYLQYTDGYVCAIQILSQPIVTYWVEVQKSDTQEGLYRLVNPYGEPYPFNQEGDYNANIDSYLYFDISDPYKVVVEKSDQTLAWAWDDGSVDRLEYCWSVAGYWRDNDIDDDRIELEGLFGTYENGKVTFAANALAAYWKLAEDEGLAYANYALDGPAMEQVGFAYYIYVTNANGTLYAPFCIDFTTLSPTIPGQPLNNQVMLSKSAYSLPKSSILLQTRAIPTPPKSKSVEWKKHKLDEQLMRRAK